MNSTFERIKIETMDDEEERIPQYESNKNAFTDIENLKEIAFVSCGPTTTGYEALNVSVKTEIGSPKRYDEPEINDVFMREGLDNNLTVVIDKEYGPQENNICYPNCTKNSTMASASKMADILDVLYQSEEESDSDTIDDIGDDMFLLTEDDGDDTLIHTVGNIEWLKYNNNSIRCKPCTFTGQPGINFKIQDPDDVLSFFKLFVTDELVEEIVIQTNIYAEEFLERKILNQFSGLKGCWIPAVKSEIYLLIGYYVMHGLIWNPEIDRYYKKKAFFATPGFFVISQKRLNILSRLLHFTNTDPPQNNKRLHKIKPILDYVNSKFSSVYTPDREILVDESLLFWKDRLSFMQFMRTKLARFGIKTYILSESKTGYICKLLVHTGSQTELIQNSNYGHATNVVLTLMRDLLQKGYCVYTDQFYCSPELAIVLKRNNTDVVGTVKHNLKGVPKEFVSQKLKKDEMIALNERYGKMMLVKWCDKREVLCLSTSHELKSTEVRRKGKDVVIPAVINDYNIFNGRVDKVDQMLSAYPLERKRHKIWYNKEFRHLINMCIFNAHVLHKKCGGQYTFLQFREALVERIVEQYFEEKLKKGRLEEYTRLKERHFPEYVPTVGKRANASRRCVVCSHGKVRRETRYQCTECDVGLCAAPCFKIFHTKKNY